MRLSHEFDLLVSLVQHKWKAGEQPDEGGKKLLVRKA